MVTERWTVHVRPPYPRFYNAFPPVLKQVLIVVFRSVAMVALVARSKLVPDFALTIHLLHLLLTTLYTRSLPYNAMWWATMLISSVLSVALGMWGCQYRELQPVFFGGGRILGAGSSRGVGASTSTPDSSAADLETGRRGSDEVGGFDRGTRRGGGRDGKGEYEMTKLEPMK